MFKSWMVLMSGWWWIVARFLLGGWWWIVGRFLLGGWWV